MRLLHTSDWHLGRTLHGIDLLDHQAAFCDRLVELVTEYDIDAVLVAGDVYDRAIPSVEAVALLSRTLARLTALTTVVITPGNHDSATRLGFGAEVMHERLRVISRMDSIGTPVSIRGRDGVVISVYALPYLDPDVARVVLADGPEGEPLPRSHEAVTRAAMSRVSADIAARAAEVPGGRAPASVVMAHAFVVGGVASESERDIRVGGVNVVPVGVFDGADYVALGHLHGPQRVGGPAAAGNDLSAADGLPNTHESQAPGVSPDRVRYSGSPLAYSFSEQHQTKSVVLVEFTGAGLASTTLLPLPVPRRLADVTGTMRDILGERGLIHRDDWVRVTVTDPQRPRELYARVHAAFPYALVIQHRPSETAVGSTAAVVTAASDPVQVAAEFVTSVTGEPATAAERAVIQRAYDDVLAAARSV